MKYILRVFVSSFCFVEGLKVITKGTIIALAIIIVKIKQRQTFTKHGH